MIRAEITNFESINHAVLEIDGFTTVQGPNYSGKSAAMRAINAALSNQAGTDFISWGKTFCEVRLVSKDLDLLWHKEDGNNFYIINNKRYDKIGRDEPPSQLNVLGYGTIKINDQRHNLYYAEQFNSLFLVDGQTLKNADLVAAVYGLDRLYKAAELCSKDQRSVDTLFKIRGKDLEDVNSDLKKFDDLDNVVTAGKRLNEQAASIESQEKSIEKAEAWSDTIAQMVVECNRLKPSLSVAVPNIEDLRERITKASKIGTLCDAMDALSGVAAHLAPVESVSVPTAEDLSSKANECLKLSDLLLRLESAENDVQRLSACGSVLVLGDGDLSSISQGISRLEFLEKSVSGIVFMKQDLDVLTKSTTESSSELVAVETELATFDVCPLCGGKRGQGCEPAAS